MRNAQPQQPYAIGMLGLGVMRRNLLLNMADHGHSVVGYDKDATKVTALLQERESRGIPGAPDLKGFIALLRQPRTVTRNLGAKGTQFLGVGVSGGEEVAREWEKRSEP